MPGEKLTYKVKAGIPTDTKILEVNPQDGDLKPWDLDSKLRQVGGRHPRLEGPQKVTGRAKYTSDIVLPGMLYAKMVRAEIPAGEVLSVDTSKAEALKGVKAVWVAPTRLVRFAGQDIAAVAAVSPEIAEDAARLVEVKLKDKAFVTDLAKAMESDAPLVYENEPLPGRDEASGAHGNVVGPQSSNEGNRGDVDQGLAEAAERVTATYYVPTHTHAPLEPHGVIAHWNGEEVTVYASTQGVSTVQSGVADALKMDRKNVIVLTEHMGGGFGSKLSPSASGSAFLVAACTLAKKAGAPVKLMLDRREEHLCTGNAPSALMTVRLGAKADGTLSAIHFRSFGSAGIADGAGTGGPARSIYTACPNVKVED